MAFKLLLLIFSVFLISEATSEKIDCDKSPFDGCGRPKVFEELPREVSEFKEQCEVTKSYIRCLKEYQDECGMDRLVLYRTEELYEATYGAISNLCEEGTLLNSVATENLKCFSDTLSKTECRKEAEEITEPYRERINQESDYEPPVDLFCLDETISHGCLLQAVHENCGELVTFATLEFITRAKTLEYACSVREAKEIMDKVDDLKLNEDQRDSVTALMENFVERNSD